MWRFSYCCCLFCFVLLSDCKVLYKKKKSIKLLPSWDKVRHKLWLGPRSFYQSSENALLSTLIKDWGAGFQEESNERGVCVWQLSKWWISETCQGYQCQEDRDWLVKLKAERMQKGWWKLHRIQLDTYIWPWMSCKWLWFPKAVSTTGMI